MREGYAGRTLVPGKLRGYRAWGHHGRDRPMLRSLTADAVWPPHVMTAYCDRNALRASCPQGPLVGLELRTHDPALTPFAKCMCGLYAVHNPHSDELHTRPCVCCPGGFSRQTVFGVIDGWGRIEVGTEGFRAEKAQIVALHVPPPKPAITQQVVYMMQPSPAGQAIYSPPSDPSNTYSGFFGGNLVYHTEVRKEEFLCPTADAARARLIVSLKMAYQVPVYSNWLDLINDYPPIPISGILPLKIEKNTPVAGGDSDPMTT